MIVHVKINALCNYLKMLVIDLSYLFDLIQINIQCRDGKSITSCWGINKFGLACIKPSKVKEWNERLVALKNMIQYWLSPENISEKTVQVIELFYDQ